MLNRISKKAIYCLHAIGRVLSNANNRKYFKALSATCLIASIFLLFNPWFYGHPKFKNSTLNAFVFVSSIILAGLALLDEFSSIVNGRSLKILLIVFACDLAWIASNKKDDQNDIDKTQQIKSDSLYKARSITNDSIRNNKRNKLYQDSLTSGLKKMATIFSNAFGEDNEKYENARKQIENIVKRDSAKQTIYNSQTRPVLDLTNIILVRKTADSLFFQLKLDAHQAIAYDVDLDIKVALADKIGNLILLTQNFDDYQSGEQLEPGKTRTARVDIKYDNYTENICFRVIGNYADFINKNQKIPFDKIMLYDIHMKELRTPSNDYFKFIRSILK